MIDKELRQAVKMNYIYSEVERWVLVTLGQKQPASATFAGIKVTIDSFDKRLDPYCRENIKLNRKPIHFGVMSQWKAGGMGTHIAANNAMEAAIEVAKSFMWCIENRANQKQVEQSEIDELEFRDEPIQYTFAF